MYQCGYSVTMPPMVSVFTARIGWVDELTGPTAPGSAAYESAARAVYCPIVLPSGCVIRRVWWANGDVRTGGATIEVGVYRDSGYGPGSKVVSGSAAQGTATQVQFVDVTDTAIPPGLYWIAIVASTATDTTIMRTSALALSNPPSFRFAEESASPLPATATPVASAELNIYLCGFATTASP